MIEGWGVSSTNLFDKTIIMILFKLKIFAKKEKKLQITFQGVDLSKKDHRPF